MEINVENAFLIAIKISLIGPLLPSINALSQKIQKRGHQILIGILKKPLLSTLVFTSALIIFLSVLTMSLIAVAAAFCAVIVIVIFEGFILGVILILAAVITILATSFLILLLGLKVSYEKKV